jgi:hypothetical protein
VHSDLRLLHAGMMRAGMDDEPEPETPFQIEGPDEDGCVWVCSPNGRDVWCQNLGLKEKVAEVLGQWLGSIDPGEDASGNRPDG